MENKLVESYFNVIAGQIVDENKIVTYKSLSRSLGIHVNTAKQLLYAYLKKEKYKNSFPISATYLVAGKVSDGSFNITIVNEADLKNSYGSFMEITSEHVYSVQKGKSLKELKVLSGISREATSSKSSDLVIKCSKNAIKIKDEVERKHEKKLLESNKNVIREALMPEKQKTVAVESKTKNENSDNKLTSSESPKKSSSKGASGKGHTNTKKPFGNIANLFAIASQKNSDNSVTNKKDEISVKNIPKEADTEVLNKANEINQNESESNNIIKERDESKDGLKKKKSGNKRKRIRLLSDSEENDSNDENPDTGIEGDSFMVNTNHEEKEKEEKIEKKESVQRNKKKKRKVVDRTVMNEDGYLETKKEVVFETDSENEQEETVAKEQVKLNVEKVKSVQGEGTVKKQASLLTFFKKA